MTLAQPRNWGRIATQALVAGIAGGFLIDLYLYLTTLRPQHTSLLTAWQWIASVAIGPAALTNPSFAWLGLLAHAVVSIGWAGGYAYFAQTQAFVNTRWAVSGLVYGVVVYFFMQILLIGARAFVFPATPVAFINDLIAHGVFFGLPVALVVARMSHKH
jgi:uncharacterized membrane protein YagU involved in acid resistance